MTARLRNEAGPTGQPGRQLLPSSPAVTRRVLQLNPGAGAARTTRWDDRVGAADAGEVGVADVATGDAEDVDRTEDFDGAADVASRACAEPHAVRVATAAAAAITVRCMRLA